MLSDPPVPPGGPPATPDPDEPTPIEEPPAPIPVPPDPAPGPDDVPPVAVNVLPPATAIEDEVPGLPTGWEDATAVDAPPVPTVIAATAFGVKERSPSA